MSAQTAPRRGRSHLLAVLGAPGARALLGARALGSLPIGMVPLGIILELRASGASYALAGLADGAYALGLATMQPPLGRLVDRFGMERVLVPLAVVFPGVLVGFALVAGGGARAPLAVALALCSGAAMPPLGACMRTLWPGLLESPELRPSAFAIDATLQELSFIAGPPLLALLVALASPRVALFAAAACGLLGAALFAARARGRHVRAVRAGGALRSAQVRKVLAVGVALGGGFGATEVAMPAFCELHGARAAAGLMLAALALGSACGGLIFGGRAANVPPSRRLAIALAFYALLVTPLLAAPSIPVMALCAFASGVPIAPAFAGSYLLLDRFSVPGTITETFAWNTTAIFAGASVGTAAGGALIAAAGYRASIALSVALGLASVAVVTGGGRRRGRAIRSDA